MWGVKGKLHPTFGRKHTDEAKAKIAASMKIQDRSGSRSPVWIADRSKLAKADEHRNDTSHHEWSKNVKNRDGWTCKIDNQDCEGRLEAHHILSYKEYPELRYQITNGITLCHAHHPFGRAEEKRLAPEFQAMVSASKALN